jgi:hypothetical protein
MGGEGSGIEIERTFAGKAGLKRASWHHTRKVLSLIDRGDIAPKGGAAAVFLAASGSNIAK